MKRLLANPVAAAVGRKAVSGSQFATVGALGLVVNQALFWLFEVVLGGHHLLIAAALATQGSTTFNFVGTEAWVFSGRRAGGTAGVVKRFLAYDAINSTALLVRLPALQVLVVGLHVNPLVGNLMTLVALTLVRYVLADSVIWSNRLFAGRTH